MLPYPVTHVSNIAIACSAGASRGKVTDLSGTRPRLGPSPHGYPPAMTTSSVPQPTSTRRHLAALDGGEPERLRLTLTWSAGCCVLNLAGSLDEDSSIALETEFDQMVRAGFDEVVLDVTSVSHLDESGAVALAELWARLRDSGVFCRVRGLHPVFADSPLELLLYVRTAGTEALTQVVIPRPGRFTPPSEPTGPTMG